MGIGCVLECNGQWVGEALQARRALPSPVSSEGTRGPIIPNKGVESRVMCPYMVIRGNSRSNHTPVLLTPISELCRDVVKLGGREGPAVEGRGNEHLTAYKDLPWWGVGTMCCTVRGGVGVRLTDWRLEADLIEGDIPAMIERLKPCQKVRKTTALT
jgi:hypothetical protein